MWKRNHKEKKEITTWLLCYFREPDSKTYIKLTLKKEKNKITSAAVFYILQISRSEVLKPPQGDKRRLSFPHPLCFSHLTLRPWHQLNTRCEEPVKAKQHWFILQHCDRVQLSILALWLKDESRVKENDKVQPQVVFLTNSFLQIMKLNKLYIFLFDSKHETEPYYFNQHYSRAV